MSFELPVVAFDLLETRISAQEAAAYAEPNLVEHYADTILDLLENETRRRDMGAAGRRRIEDTLSWRHQVPQYVGVYDRLSLG
jgi:glycosyltransferase involved in cell wall biosynthesis